MNSEAPLHENDRNAKLLRRRTRTDGTKETAGEYATGTMLEEYPTHLQVNISRFLKRSQIVNRLAVGLVIGSMAYILTKSAVEIYEEYQSKKSYEQFRENR